MDTYSVHKGVTTPAVVTGKPVSIGGSEGREGKYSVNPVAGVGAIES